LDRLLIEEASSEADWFLLLFANLGLELGLGLAKGAFPMNPAPPTLCCGQLGSFRLAKTAEAIEVQNHSRLVRFCRRSGASFPMPVKQSMSQLY